MNSNKEYICTTPHILRQIPWSGAGVAPPLSGPLFPVPDRIRIWGVVQGPEALRAPIVRCQIPPPPFALHPTYLRYPSSTLHPILNAIRGKQVLEAICAEHTSAVNSDVEFETSNYGLICTPRQELEAGERRNTGRGCRNRREACEGGGGMLLIPPPSILNPEN